MHCVSIFCHVSEPCSTEDLKTGEIQRILTDQLDLLDKVGQAAGAMRAAGSADDWMKMVLVVTARYWWELAMDFQGLISCSSGVFSKFSHSCSHWAVAWCTIEARGRTKLWLREEATCIVCFACGKSGLCDCACELWSFFKLRNKCVVFIGISSCSGRIGDGD